MDRVVEVNEKYGLALNIKKTKFKIISKNYNLGGQLKIQNQRIERIQQLSYLERIINKDWNPSLEIKCKIERANEAIRKISNLFKFHDVSLGTKIGLLRCYVFSVL